MKIIMFTTMAVSLAFFGSNVAIAVPAAVPYVGYLADDEAPFNGAVAVSVEIYDQAENGISLWGPHEFLQVGVQDGVFAIVLGAADSPELESSLLPAQGAWLDFAIDGLALTPRQQLLSVPYSLLAGQAEFCDQAMELDEQAASEFAQALHNHDGAYVNAGQVASVSADMLATGAVTSEAIQDQSIGFEDLSPNGCAPGDAVRFNGSVWVCEPVLAASEVLSTFAPAAALAEAVARIDSAESRLEVLEVNLAEQTAMSTDLQSKVDDLLLTVMDLEVEITAATLALAELQQQTFGNECPADMVPVGDFCVDKVEASMWRRVDGSPVDCEAVQNAVDQAAKPPWSWSNSDFNGWYTGVNTACESLGEKPGLCQYQQFGSPPGCKNFDTCDDYPVPDNGNFDAPLYSCAIVGMAPARACTWFQAQQACVWSGKRLCDNAEWQAAAAGTPDPHIADPGDDVEPCNIWGNSKPEGSTWAALGQSIKAGTAKDCVSAHGAYDMVGNLMELASDWWGQGPDNGDGKQANPSYNKDGFWNIDDAEHSGISPPYATFPSTAHRGGAWDYGFLAGVFSICLTDGPAHHFHGVGYRCCRNQ
jgi:formylglycine-generating enzyme required for sulfatase activity